MPGIDLEELLKMYSANEIKRQGCLVGQPIGKYRAWLYEGYLVVIDEDKNDWIAVYDMKDLNRRTFRDLDSIGEAILVAAGVR